MDFEKMTIEEVRKLDSAGMRETEVGIRRQLASMRMDVYTSANAQSGKVGKLKTGLARILTVKTEQLRAAAETAPKVPVAPKATPAKKVVKAAAPKAAPAAAKVAAAAPKTTKTKKKA